MRYEIQMGTVAITIACLFACGKPIADPDRKLANDAIEGSVGGVRLALAAGGDVNQRLPEGKTVLMWTCSRANVNGDDAAEIVRLLVEAGADVNARAADGSTALGWAANSPNLPVVQRMIDAGAEINVQNERGWTPLMAAASCGLPLVL